MATESQKQDTSSRSGKMLMLMIGLSDPYIMKSQWLRYNADDNVSAIATTAYEQPEFNNEGKADQASVFMAMTSVHISSGLVLHQMTSDHNRSELENSRYSNAVSSSGFKSVPLESKTATPDKSWIYYSPSLSL
ncbi:hypothetical protein Tco_1446839 [Tanacetum coccineum]